MAAGTSLGGRPTLYTAEVATLILARLADGESLRAICRSDESLPAESTVRLWAIEGRHAGEEDTFDKRYARARDMGLDAMADEMLEIADTPQVGETTRDTKDGPMTTIGDMIEHRRLRVDARKWRLAKMAPKRYGDRLALAGDDSSPISVFVNKPG